MLKLCSKPTSSLLTHDVRLQHDNDVQRDHGLYWLVRHGSFFALSGHRRLDDNTLCFAALGSWSSKPLQYETGRAYEPAYCEPPLCAAASHAARAQAKLMWPSLAGSSSERCSQTSKAHCGFGFLLFCVFPLLHSWAWSWSQSDIDLASFPTMVMSTLG